MDWDLEGMRRQREAEHWEEHTYRPLHTDCDGIYEVTRSLKLLPLGFPTTMAWNLELGTRVKPFSSKFFSPSKQFIKATGNEIKTNVYRKRCTITDG